MKEQRWWWNQMHSEGKIVKISQVTECCRHALQCHICISKADFYLKRLLRENELDLRSFICFCFEFFCLLHQWTFKTRPSDSVMWTDKGKWQENRFIITASIKVWKKYYLCSICGVSHQPDNSLVKYLYTMYSTALELPYIWYIQRDKQKCRLFCLQCFWKITW